MSSEKTSQHTAKPYLPIEDYAPIGDLHTIALVGKNSSIDWCCLPRFDSPSVFGALLDTERGGFFRIAPVGESEIKYKQMYLPETNILLTRFLGKDGVGELTDFMPMKRARSDHYQHRLIRSLSVVHGSLTFLLVCRPGFNYARDPHHIEICKKGALFHSKHLCLSLSSPLQLEQHGKEEVRIEFTLHMGESVHFVLESTREHPHVSTPLSDARFQAILQETLCYWHNWLAQCSYQGRWRGMVRRSALVLKLMTYAPTGAIVAAPTTSLPETLGGGRNWDYRYTWVRDASFTLASLLDLGFTQEAEAFMNWLDARCHELAEDGSLQPMYGIDGGHGLTEQTLDHLEGYRQSRPVRIGNGAYTQQQLGIYGELLEAIAIYNRYDAISYDLWENILRLLDWLSQHWDDPDEGIWEVRGGAKPFVNSRVMSWVAFDRALRIAQERGWPAPVDKWRKIRAQIYEQIMKKGWNGQKGSFTQYYGSEALDASILLMSSTGFISSKEPHMLASIECIQQHLTNGALVRRYNPEVAADTGTGRKHEGTFGACCFWLVENLARLGRLDEARLLLEKIFSYSNHVGLYAEEISPTGEALGNFPQAFTHLALITACLTLDDALNKQWAHGERCAS